MTTRATAAPHFPLLVCVAAVLAAGPLAGCEVDTGGGASGTKPPAVTVTVPTPRPIQPDRIVTVPNVVGKNHQVAQDTLQAAGFFKLTEQDATGRNRPLLVDRNWVVVQQQPKAGSRVRADTTIVLRSKRSTDG
jgi:beta-lactam-binding protein with PASTA domain